MARTQVNLVQVTPIAADGASGWLLPPRRRCFPRIERRTGRLDGLPVAIEACRSIAAQNAARRASRVDEVRPPQLAASFRLKR